MATGKILLPAHECAAIEPMSKTAFILANRLDAMVQGLYAFTPPADQVYLYYDDSPQAYREDFLKEAEKRSEAAQKSAREMFTRWAKDHAGLESAFETCDQGLVEGITNHGRLADMTVVNRSGEGDSFPWSQIRNAAMFQTGRPVMVVPDAPVPDMIGREIIIGWKNSVEAARALQAVKPFLAGAESIRIVSAGEDAVSLDELQSVKDYLSLSHGNVDCEVLGKPSASPGEILLEEASAQPNALLVMGAFSHWKLTEWVFGGVTDHVLRNTTVPVLMAH